jgi:outer membrane protein TolC
VYSRFQRCLLAVGLLAQTIPGLAAQNDPTTGAERAAGAALLLARAISDPQLKSLVIEALERNPEIGILSARARAAESRAPQAKGLPDPVLGATAWVDGPETRTGPQVLTLSLMQRASSSSSPPSGVSTSSWPFWHAARPLLRTTSTISVSTRTSRNHAMPQESARARMLSRFRPRSPWQRSC